jgi:thiosulfate sulfurtransferase
MTQFKHISCADTLAKIENGNCVIADIRDENAFSQAHIDGSIHLTNGNLSQFMQQVDEDTSVIVVCYHGRSSQGAAQYLVEQGYEDVYSMDGGFEHWRTVYDFTSK